MHFVAAFLGSTLVAAPPTAQRAEGADFHRAVVRTMDAVKQLEFVQMLRAVLKGSQMGPGDGWFKSGQSRYGWKWLAAHAKSEKENRITEAEFPGSPELFRRLDRNRHGLLTPDDFDWSDN